MKSVWKYIAMWNKYDLTMKHAIDIYCDLPIIIPWFYTYMKFQWISYERVIKAHCVTNEKAMKEMWNQNVLTMIHVCTIYEIATKDRELWNTIMKSHWKSCERNVKLICSEHEIVYYGNEQYTVDGVYSICSQIFGFSKHTAIYIYIYIYYCYNTLHNNTDQLYRHTYNKDAWVCMSYNQQLHIP